MKCNGYEEERTSLRETVERGAGVRMGEMAREEQMCFILCLQEVQGSGKEVNMGDGGGVEFLGEDVEGEV